MIDALRKPEVRWGSWSSWWSRQARSSDGINVDGLGKLWAPEAQKGKEERRKGQDRSASRLSRITVFASCRRLGYCQPYLFFRPPALVSSWSVARKPTSTRDTPSCHLHASFARGLVFILAPRRQSVSATTRTAEDLPFDVEDQREAKAGQEASASSSSQLWVSFRPFCKPT